MKIKNILSNFRWQFGLTLTLILLESGLALLFPLFIGFAIDGALNGATEGAVQLGILGLIALAVGVSRRLYDSRFYAQVFQLLGMRVVSKMGGNDPSKKSARLGMIREMVEFMENSLPELIGNVIGLIGVVVIIASLNFNVFIGGVVSTVLIFIVYLATSGKTVRLNKAYNDELEKQVDAVAANQANDLEKHLRDIMKWNVKLSDLEAMNFSIAWIVLMIFLVMSVIISVEGGIVKYGALFSLIMYVFQYMESVVNLPLFYQDWLRLTEIRDRLENV